MICAGLDAGGRLATAVIVTDNWDIHLHQDLGKAATSIKTSTDHGVSNLILSIRATAVIITDRWNIHLHQDLGKAATLRGGSPSRDSTGGSSSVFLPVRWEHD